MQTIEAPGLSTLALAPAPACPPDVTAEPRGFIVLSDDGTRIHFLDWGAPAGGARTPGILLVPGLVHTGWTWAPVARRLRGVARVVAMDLRGHGLSDAPSDGYEPDVLAGDAIAAAEGSGVLAFADEAEEAGAPFVLAGLGFGAVVAAWTANALGRRCAGLVLVDGGWEDLGATSEATPAEWLAAIEEPPQVLASMDAWLADRRAFDPATWDADQERAARLEVVETAAGRVKRAVHSHALAGSVAAMFAYQPGRVLPNVEARILALIADDQEGVRQAALASVAAKRVASQHGAIAMAAFPGRGHNLARHEPDAVAAAILAATLTGPSPGDAPVPP